MDRCDWCKDDALYIQYHDEEWGVPVHDDRTHFEFLVLESMQAGLSWLTILRKRENFRKAFDNFDPGKVAQYDEIKIAELLNNSGIIRNRRKIEAAINNAQRFLEVQSEFGSFDNYIWGFTNGKVINNSYTNVDQIPATTDLAYGISKDFKKRGFKFLGPIITYSHLQAVGIVNDHIDKCYKKTTTI